MTDSAGASGGSDSCLIGWLWFRFKDEGRRLKLWIFKLWLTFCNSKIFLTLSMASSTSLAGGRTWVLLAPNEKPPYLQREKKQDLKCEKLETTDNDFQNKSRTEDLKRPTWIRSPRLCSSGWNKHTGAVSDRILGICGTAVYSCVSQVSLTSCRWSLRRFSPGSRRCFFLSGSAECRWRWDSSERRKTGLLKK